MCFNIPYTLKRALPMLAMAAAPMFTSCDKDDEPLHDVELVYHRQDYEPVSIENLTRLSKDPSVQTIYMCIRPNEDCLDYETRHISNVRGFFTERLNISPKIRGRGDYHFTPGAATVDDSLFFVRNGWTINQTPLKQR